ncbi:MAG: TRAP transporter substrate-binding protein [Rhodospirillaceae bacterium]|nr:TRAP transporter substrate-binding protein [Rhodospirillaceae bacterium]
MQAASRFLVFATALTLVVAWALVAPSGVQAQMVKDGKVHIIYANTYQPPWPSTQVYVRDMARKLASFSDNRITIEMFQQATLCSEHKCVEQMNQKSVDMTNISVGNVGAFGRTLDFLILPYLFESDEAALEIMRGWLHDELNRRAEKEMNIHIVGWVPFCGYRQVLHNVDRDIKVPGDLRGVKIRTTKSPAEFALMKAWEAVAVPYDWTQVYTGLQSGIIQGMFNMECHLEMSDFHEVMGRSTHVDGAWHIQMTVQNAARREAELPDWAQQAIDRTGAYLEYAILAQDKEATKLTLERLTSKGRVQIYYPTAEEMALWRQGAVGVWAEFKGSYDPEIVRRVLNDQGNTAFIEELEAAGAL